LIKPVLLFTPRHPGDQLQEMVPRIYIFLQYCSMS